MRLLGTLLRESRNMTDLPYVQFNVWVYTIFSLLQVLTIDFKLLGK